MEMTIVGYLKIYIELCYRILRIGLDPEENLRNGY